MKGCVKFDAPFSSAHFLNEKGVPEISSTPLTRQTAGTANEFFVRCNSITTRYPFSSKLSRQINRTKIAINSTPCLRLNRRPLFAACCEPVQKCTGWLWTDQSATQPKAVLPKSTRPKPGLLLSPTCGGIISTAPKQG